MENKSFTLIELLVVIVIIGILAGVIMISTSSSIDKANLAKINMFSEGLKNTLMDELIGEWKLDEGSGTNIYDSWGNNHGALSAGAEWKNKTDCVSGSCLYFPATGKVVIPYNNNFFNKNEITIEMWVKVSNNDQNWEEFFIIGSTDRLEVGAIGSYGLWLNGGNCNNVWKKDEWFHLIYSSSATITQTSVYINGKILADKANYSNLPYTENNITLGSYGSESFDGSLDEVRIYNKYINANQAKTLYANAIKPINN